MSNRTLALSLASAVGAAVALTAASSAAQAQTSGDKERCYGISLAGKNDCAATGNNSCAGTSKMDFDGGAWKYVAKGSCAGMQITLKSGATRKGSLMPVKG